MLDPQTTPEKVVQLTERERHKLLLSKLKNKKTRIAVIGLGRIGLPLALSFAYNGFNVTGVDISFGTLALLGKDHVPFHEPNLHHYLVRSKNEGNFEAVNSLEKAKDIDVIFITIGVDLDSNYHPVYSKLKQLLESITYTKELLIILRPTVSPGTMKDIVMPTIRKTADKQNGLILGLDFWVSYVPERLAEGKAIEELKSLPVIVGTDSSFVFDYVAHLFRSLNPNKKIMKCQMNEAEFVKLFCNAYRYVNFALANQFALLTAKHNVHANRVIRFANDSYPRGGIPKPGLVGGYCLSKDGFLLTQDPEGNFLSDAWRLNEFLPSYIVETARAVVKDLYGITETVHYQIWGITFKRDSDDMRLSPAWKLALLLKNYGEHIMSVEPNIDYNTDYNIITLQQAGERSKLYKTCVIVAMNHSEFYNDKPYTELAKDTIVIDIWDCLSYYAQEYLPNVYKFGRDF